MSNSSNHDNNKDTENGIEELKALSQSLPDGNSSCNLEKEARKNWEKVCEIAAQMKNQKRTSDSSNIT